MAQNKKGRFGPIALTNAVVNYLNPPTGSGGVGLTAANQYILLKHLRFVNKSGATATVAAYVGATGGSAAGTEILGPGYSIAAGDYKDWWAQGDGMRMEVADFLTMIASANTAITVSGEYEIGVTG